MSTTMGRRPMRRIHSFKYCQFLCISLLHSIYFSFRVRAFGSPLFRRNTVKSPLRSTISTRCTWPLVAPHCIARQRTSFYMNRRNYQGSDWPSRDGNRRPWGRRQRKNTSHTPPVPPPGSAQQGCFRDLLCPGKKVSIVQKQDQRTGVETEGIIDRLLTNSQYHPRGIKVLLVSGLVGRVTRIISES